MYGIFTLLLLVLPLIFQILFGLKSSIYTIKLSLSKVCLFSIILQVIISYLVYNSVLQDLKNTYNGEPRCGMPMVAIVTFELFLIILLFAIIVIQYLIKVYYKRKIK